MGCEWGREGKELLVVCLFISIYIIWFASILLDSVFESLIDNKAIVCINQNLKHDKIQIEIY